MGLCVLVGAVCAILEVDAAMWEADGTIWKLHVACDGQMGAMCALWE
jgi:hypothetical protein